MWSTGEPGAYRPLGPVETGAPTTTAGARAVGAHERGSDRRPQLGRGRKPVPCR